jgi:diacylglycerol kinase (ATP)
VRAWLIVNPRSGADRAPELLPLINERLRTLVTDLDITLSTEEQDIVRAATRAVDAGCELLFIAGGDGTLNIALGAVAAIDGALDGLTFGIIPSGTGNDFAKALDLGEAAEPALETLLSFQCVDVDVGLLNDRAFVNVSAGGYVADVSAMLTEGLKDVTGKLSYIIGGARALLGREPFAADVGIAQGAAEAHGATTQPYSGLALQMFAVCNARFIGGGYPIAPTALIDDGLLDVFLVKRTSTLEFVALLQKIAAGAHGDDERILRFRSSDLELTFDRSINVNMDGEAFETDRCRYRVRHRAARFLCGARPHTSAPPRDLMV